MPHSPINSTVTAINYSFCCSQKTQKNLTTVPAVLKLPTMQSATNYTLRKCHWDGIYEVTMRALSRGGRSEEVAVSITLGTWSASYCVRGQHHTVYVINVTLGTCSTSHCARVQRHTGNMFSIALGTWSASQWNAFSVTLSTCSASH